MVEAVRYVVLGQLNQKLKIMVETARYFSSCKIFLAEVLMQYMLTSYQWLINKGKLMKFKFI